MRPFEIHPETGDPFLRLRSPYDTIVLTAPRKEYADAIVEIVNDPIMYPFINAPHPHTREHAEAYLEKCRKVTDEVWSEIKAKGTEESHVFGGVPVRSICEIQANGSWVYLGDFGFVRAQAKQVLEPELREQATKENYDRPVGDPEIDWAVGCGLSMIIFVPYLPQLAQITLKHLITGEGSYQQYSKLS